MDDSGQHSSAYKPSQITCKIYLTVGKGILATQQPVYKASKVILLYALFSPGVLCANVPLMRGR